MEKADAQGFFVASLDQDPGRYRLRLKLWNGGEQEIDDAVSHSEVRAPELELAKQIIASLSADFEPAELRSEYRASLKEMLEAKLEGRELEVPEEVVETPVVDLMEALRASVAAANKPAAKGGTGKKAAAPARRKAAAGRK